MNTAENFGNFDLVRRFKLAFTDVTVSKWRSRITGLTIVHLDYEGQQTVTDFMHTNLNLSPLAPIIDGYFVVASESMSFSITMCDKFEFMSPNSF
jgi:hypothetical protein